MSNCTDVRDSLATHGVLLLQDKVLLDVVGMLAGGKLSTSWWSHARGQVIFACLEHLSDDPDVIASRLVAGKVTYVHRRLWPEFLAVARSGEAWQTRGISKPARQLLDSMSDSGTRASGQAARELQDRLLVYARQVHTEGGRHELHLQPWSAARKTQHVIAAPSVAAARATIEKAVVGIGGSAASLPWHRFGDIPTVTSRGV